MKRSTIFPVMLALTFFAQHTKAQDYICEYAGRSQRKQLTVSAPPKVAVDRINTILNVVGLSGNFSVLSANVDNAIALVQGNKRYILFNPYYMQEIQNQSQSVWTTYSILAHEIGHHLNGHTIGAHRTAHQGELEADEFSGFILGKLGATRSEAQLAMAMIAETYATPTHPGRKARLNSIARGWERAVGE